MELGGKQPQNGVGTSSHREMSHGSHAHSLSLGLHCVPAAQVTRTTPVSTSLPTQDYNQVKNVASARAGKVREGSADPEVQVQARTAGTRTEGGQGCGRSRRRRGEPH